MPSPTDCARCQNRQFRPVGRSSRASRTGGKQWFGERGSHVPSIREKHAHTHHFSQPAVVPIEVSSPRVNTPSPALGKPSRNPADCQSEGERLDWTGDWAVRRLFNPVGDCRLA